MVYVINDRNTRAEHLRDCVRGRVQSIVANIRFLHSWTLDPHSEYMLLTERVFGRSRRGTRHARIPRLLQRQGLQI